MFWRIRAERLRPNRFHHLFDVLRCRSAAAAEKLNTEIGNPSHPVCKLVRAHVVNGSAVLLARQARIRRHDNRHRSHLGETLCDRIHLLRPEAAVHAEGINAEPFEHRDRRVDRASGQKFSRSVVNRRDEDRKITVFLCSQDRRLCLIGIAHGLDEHKVRAGRRTDSHHLSEKLHCPVEGKIPHRLEKFSRGPDVQCDIGILLASGSPARFLCKIHSRRHDLFEAVRVLEPVRAEGVCVENVGSGIQVIFRNFYDHFRVGKIPLLRKLPARKALCLQKRSHASVKEKPLFAQSLS